MSNPPAPRPFTASDAPPDWPQLLVKAVLRHEPSQAPRRCVQSQPVAGIPKRCTTCKQSGRCCRQREQHVAIPRHWRVGRATHERPPASRPALLVHDSLVYGRTRGLDRTPPRSFSWDPRRCTRPGSLTWQAGRQRHVSSRRTLRSPLGLCRTALDRMTVNRTPYVHEAVISLAVGTDPQAVGAAVTTELCGAAEHDGPCPWPHNNAIERGEGVTVFRIVFVAPSGEEREVRRHIRSALRSSDQWVVISDRSSSPKPSERTLAGRLERTPTQPIHASPPRDQAGGGG